MTSTILLTPPPSPQTKALEAACKENINEPLITSDENHCSTTETTEIAVLQIKGMTCSSCVSAIENGINSKAGVISVAVNLIMEKAEIFYDAAVIRSPFEFTVLITDLGFEAALLDKNGCNSQQTENSHCQLKLKIFGMTCSSCSSAIEENLPKAFEDKDAIKSISVNLSLESALIVYDSKRIPGPRSIIAAIQDLGFDAVLASSNEKLQLESLSKATEIARWKSNFYSTLYLSIPEMILSMILVSFEPFSSLLHHNLIPGLSLLSLFEFCLVSPIQFGKTSRTFYTRAWRSLKHGSPSMDVLIALGTSAAYAFSVFSILCAVAMQSGNHHHVWTFFETSASLLTFISLGKLLEVQAKAKTTTALTQLLNLRPNTATLVRTGEEKKDGEQEIETDLLQINDTIKVKPGTAIPIDGIVISGNGSVNESLITGESKPIEKAVGDSVIAGSVNENGIFFIRCTAVGSQTLLSRIVMAVEDAQNSRKKTALQLLSDKICRWFVPCVLVLSFATFVTWYALLSSETIALASLVSSSSSSLSSNFVFSLQLALAVLVIACPCAIGLAAPTAVMVGTGVAASLGVLIKGGSEAIQMASKLSVIVFDKTGTLTNGKLSVSRVAFFPDEEKQGSEDGYDSHAFSSFVNGSAVGKATITTKQEFMYLVMKVEQHCNHPIAQSLIGYIQENQQISLLEKEKEAIIHERLDLVDVEVVSGFGVKAKLAVTPMEKKEFVVGNLSMLLQCGVHIRKEIIQEGNFLSSQGLTMVWVALDGIPLGYFALRDAIKNESKQLVTELQRQGMRVVMMSGDAQTTTSYIGNQLGITQVYGGLSPQGKAAAIQELQKDTRTGRRVYVGMVGDGINDSVALSTADIGFAVPSSTDIALEAASIVLLNSSNLLSIIAALHLCKKIQNRIKWNFLWAFLYNALGIPLAAGLALVPFGIVLHPMIAGMAMAASSLSVLSSSLLLKYYKPPALKQEPPSESSMEHSNSSSETLHYYKDGEWHLDESKGKQQQPKKVLLPKSSVSQWSLPWKSSSYLPLSRHDSSYLEMTEIV